MEGHISWCSRMRELLPWMLTMWQLLDVSAVDACS